MIEPLKNIFKTKTVQRIQNNKLLKGGILFFLVLIAVLIASAALFPSPQRANNQLPAELQEIEKSIKEARNKTDPFVRERFIQQEARKLKLTSDEYKKLYALRKRDSEMLPDAPDSQIEQVKWFYQGLSREQRFSLMRIWLVWIFERSSTLTIVFVGGRFLWEIPRREKEAKYQAWQVIHTAHGQKVSGARIAALEDLHEQRESLAGLALEEGANLSGINLPKVNLNNANLNNANLSRADLNGADLIGAKLCYACLINADLIGANLAMADLNGADLIGAKLNNANLNNANLSRADLNGADLIGAKLSDTRLIGAKLSDTNLSDAELYLADLSGADLISTKFNGANLNGSNLNGANLCETNFSGAKLNGADLRETHIFNVDFSQTAVEQAKFSNGSGLTEVQERDLQQRGAIFDDEYAAPSSP